MLITPGPVRSVFRTWSVLIVCFFRRGFERPNSLMLEVARPREENPAHDHELGTQGQTATESGHERVPPRLLLKYPLRPGGTSAEPRSKCLFYRVWPQTGPTTKTTVILAHS